MWDWNACKISYGEIAYFVALLFIILIILQKQQQKMALHVAEVAPSWRPNSDEFDSSFVRA